MNVKVSVPTAARLTGLSIAVLREAIASGALRATLQRGEGNIEPYHVHVKDLAAWCQRCGYTHLWSDPARMGNPGGRC